MVCFALFVFLFFFFGGWMSDGKGKGGRRDVEV